MLLLVLPPAAAKEKLIDFKKLEIAAQKAPDFALKGGTTEKRNKQKDWMEIEFEIEAKAPKGAPKDLKFLDNLQVKFFVVMQPADATKRKVMLLADVTYNNVPIGNDAQHMVVYLSPASLVNITGDKIVNKAMIQMVGAEVTYNGAMVGRYPETGPTAEFWKLPAAPAPETGRLLPKHLTPFAPLWYDYYLEEKADK